MMADEQVVIARGGPAQRGRGRGGRRGRGGHAGGGGPALENDVGHPRGGRRNQRWRNDRGEVAGRGGRGGRRGGRGGGAPNGTEDNKSDSDSECDFADLDSMISRRRMHRSGRIWPVGFKSLEELATRPEQEIMLALQDSAFGFKELLEQDKIMPKTLVVVLSVLHKASGASQRCPNNSILLFNNCLGSSLFTVHVPRLLTSAPFERPGAADEVPLADILRHLVGLFQILLDMFPAKASETLGVVFLTCRDVATQLAARGTPLDEITSEKLARLEVARMEVLGKYDARALNERAKSESAQVQPPPDDFRSMSRTPTLADVHEILHPFLRPNVVGGRYADAEHYLDVHFRLIREDFVAPLRDGLNNLLSLVALSGAAAGQQNRGRAAREINVKVYDQVRVVAMECCPYDCIINVLRFSLRSLARVRWDATKRLLHGSLVCLSADNFLTMRLAVIVRRDPAKLREGILSVRFLRDTDGWTEPSARDEFTMVESPAYFEAYEPILRGLQLQDGTRLPFRRYIVNGETVVASARYLTPTTVYDLRSLLLPEVRLSVRSELAKACRVDDPFAWPPAEDFGLDAAQYSALRLGLTNEMALIQGPPGTGKTFLGLKMVEALLHNHQAWSGNDHRQPILVICYTNHALDQFLEGIVSIYKRDTLVEDYTLHTVVRVGGQSKCETLKKCNLTELRRTLVNERNIPAFVHNTRKRKLWNLQLLQYDIEEQMHLIQTAETKILSESILQLQMTPRHHEQLTNNPFRPFQEQRRSRKGGRSVIVDWLGVAGSAGLGPEVPDEVMETAVTNGVEENGFDEGDEYDPLADEEMRRRVVDDDYTFFRFQANHRGRGDAQRHAKRRTRMDNQCFANYGGDDDDTDAEGGAWTVQGGIRAMHKYISGQIRGAASMTQEEAHAVRNIWNLGMDDRWRLYRLWLQTLRTLRMRAVEHLKERYEAEQKSLLEVQRELDIHILRDAKVIGMTTTGAAKHREILQVIAPRIVVVEEAAEVMEAHIITALTDDCQHLILIGDQQQLRPSPTVYKLAKDFHLDVSLFERLIANGVAYECLLQQHRMRPEIATLLVPHIYPHLRNHPSVERRQNVRGITKNVFFLSHNHTESSVADSTSRQNQFEANFVVALCRYLMLQGYEADKITILSTYVGQLYLIRQLARETIVKNVRCTVVDNYQGEENDIIILSLVRSNVEGMVGFLRTDNRVCVALSRARDGLYCVGNVDMLAEKSDLWRKIVETLGNDGHVGTHLTLACQNHPEQRTEVFEAVDFERAPEGGCSLPCEYRLTCGHRCPKACHNYDKEHTEMKCNKSCERTPDGCQFKHKCPKQCHADCGRCLVVVPRELRCGHVDNMPCHRNPLAHPCQQRCRKSLACGHQCTKLCSDECDQTTCHVLVKAASPCGHEVMVQCCRKSDSSAMLKACRAACDKILSCEHHCGGNCSACHQGRFHQRCAQKCERLQVCGHPCPVPCANNCPPCQGDCENRCEHSRCPARCGFPCKSCVEPCAWRCPHLSCTRLCHEACDRPACNQPCPREVPRVGDQPSCGHPCIGLCGETCPPRCRLCHHDEVCEIFLGSEDEPDARYVYLEDCKHLFEVHDLDRWMATQTEPGPDGHLQIAMKKCPRCSTVIRRNSRYGRQIRQLLDDVVSIKRKIFGNVRDVKRDLKELKTAVLDSDIVEEAEAVAPNDGQPHFFTPCRKQLKEDVTSQPSMSVGELTVLQNKFKFLLRLEAIWKEVPTTRRRRLLVPEALIHERLSQDDPFRLKMVDMRRWLMHNLPNKETSEQQLHDFSRELQRLVMLTRLLSAVSFDTTSVAREGGAHFTALFGILTGRQPFTDSTETTAQQMWKKLSEQLDKIPGLDVTRKEADAIVLAMGMGQGHWYKCPNGHLYAIGDCGGAVVQSRCIECSATVGGANHLVVEGNQFTNVLDGATRPANPFYRDEYARQ